MRVAGAVPQTDLFAMSDVERNDGLAIKFRGVRRLTIKAWDALKSACGSVVLTSGASAWPEAGAQSDLIVVTVALRCPRGLHVIAFACRSSRPK